MPKAGLVTLGPLLSRPGAFVWVGNEQVTKYGIVDVSGASASGGVFPRSLRMTASAIGNTTRYRFGWPWPAATAVTLIAMCNNLSAWNCTPIGLFDPSSAGNGHYLTVQTDGIGSIGSYANNTGWVAAAGQGTQYGVNCIVGCVNASGAGRRCSVNGGPVKVENTTRQPVTLTNIVIGNYFSSGVGVGYQALNGHLYMAAVLPFVISDFEMRQISANPWSLLIERQPPIPDLSRPKGTMRPTVRI